MYVHKEKDYSNYSLLTRKEAIIQGNKYYFTGVPCMRGHIAPRFTTGGTCLECNYLAAKAKYYGEKLPRVKGTDLEDQYQSLDNPVNGIALQIHMLKESDQEIYQDQFRHADSFNAALAWRRAEASC
jgi:hypothetical protein